mmetsp:Transcript_1285/g.2722  ORF Transcript_1285/g.2722 Transcript_1285/m.2722 type:complete len:91 (-) Transcript_1285:991-1263(-)
MFHIVTSARLQQNFSFVILGTLTGEQGRGGHMEPGPSHLEYDAHHTRARAKRAVTSSTPTVPSASRSFHAGAVGEKSISSSRTSRQRVFQ